MQKHKIKINLGLFFLCIILLNEVVYSQQIQRYQAISAYIYNFAKNIQWLNEADLKEIQLLMVGNDEKIFQELNQLSKTRTIRNLPIKINASTAYNPTNSVQLIFLTKGNEENLVKIFDAIEGKNILLISDGYKDKRLIMINFFNADDGTLKFEINKANIINQNLTILPDVIFAGGTEIDVAALYFEGQQSLRSLQKHSEQTESNLIKLENNLMQKTAEVNLMSDSLTKQRQKIIEKQNILEAQKLLLADQDNKMQMQLKKIEQQQKIFLYQSNEIKQQLIELQNGKNLLLKQKAEIDIQKETIAKHKVELKNLSEEKYQQELKINRQNNLVVLLIIILILVILLILNIYNGYRLKHKRNKELESKVLERTKELQIINAKLQTELKDKILAEEKIRSLNISLEQRVTERTEQLLAINKELESFSYSISHDLRAPLRAIFGFSQIISRRHKSNLNEEGQQYLDYIVEASVRMEQLINDLLNYSRLGRKAIELRPIPLNLIVNNIYTDFKQRLDEIGASFLFSKDLPTLPGDESLLRQIFTNLIGNAITYRKQDVPLEIKIETKQTDCITQVSISDNGIGIPREHWEKIFNIFQRLHADDKYPGTGIGLSTVKKAVSILNGNITLESEVGQGTTFIMQFKLQKN